MFFPGANEPAADPDGQLGTLPYWFDNPLTELKPSATKDHWTLFAWDYCNGGRKKTLKTSEGETWTKD
jgi:hypothetical protein